MDIVSEVKSHGGIQGVYRHESRETGTGMTFALFLPPQASKGRCPVLWYLSGLTCTHANVMEKGEYRRLAAELGLIIVCPDTSPRGEGVPDEPDNWQFGSGAGFYVDATEKPFDRHYRMYSYVTQELPELIAASFAADMDRQGIFGHSMGGHGALTIALRNTGIYRSVSAFAPIASPTRCPWGEKALAAYLGADPAAWRKHDATLLLEDGIGTGHYDDILVDQGTGDSFLEKELKPDLLQAAAARAGQKLTLRMQEGYDHSYYFIQSFIADHLQFHHDRLK